MFENNESLLAGIYTNPPTVTREHGGNAYIAQNFEIRQEFINESSESVTIVTRNGAPMRLPAAEGVNRGRIIIRHTVKIPRAHVGLTEDYLKSQAETAPSVLRAMRDALAERENPLYANSALSLTLEYVITRETLRQYGNALYYHCADVMVTTSKDRRALVHPRSQLGQLHATQTAATPVGFGGGGALYAVEIIDSTGAFGDRYLNIANEVYPVRAKQDPERADGVWLTRTEPTKGKYAASSALTKYYTLTEDDGSPRDFAFIGLYGTYKDAEALGDIATVRKEELVQKELDLQEGRRALELSRQETERFRQDSELQRQEHERERQTIDAELVELKTRSERENLEHKARTSAQDEHNKRLQAERDQLQHDLEIERMRKKDQYEERSQSRKNAGEILKSTPTLIVAGLGVASCLFALLRR